MFVSARLMMLSYWIVERLSLTVSITLLITNFPEVVYMVVKAEKLVSLLD